MNMRFLVIQNYTTWWYRYNNLYLDNEKGVANGNPFKKGVNELLQGCKNRSSDIFNAASAAYLAVRWRLHLVCCISLCGP